MSKTHTTKVKADAAAMVQHFANDIVEQIELYGEASRNLNDLPGGDRYHHESHVDRAYSLREAAELLEELAEHEETDSGLWEGLPPRSVISAQAAYTYGNAVWHAVWNLIERINDRVHEFDGEADTETLHNFVQAECNLFAEGN